MSRFNVSMNGSIEQLPEATQEEALAATESQNEGIPVADNTKSVRKEIFLSAPTTPTQPNQLCTLNGSSAPVTPLSREYIAVLSPPPTSPTCPVVVNPTNPTFAAIHMGTPNCWIAVNNVSLNIKDENDFSEITSVGQYGGGRKRKASQSPKKKNKKSAQEPNANYINGTGAPTKEELDFLEKYAVASATDKFTKRSNLYSSLDPVMYRFQNYEDLTDNLEVLHHHCAKIFDIIIRKNVYAAGGNMNTEFWFGFCYKCSKWDNTNHHKRCKAKCWYCGFAECTGQGHEKIHCTKCDIYFKSQDCYDRHLKPANGQALPNCEKFFYCTKCHHYDRRTRYAGAPHICGATTFCQICRMKAKAGHECKHHLPTEEEKKKKKEKQEKWVVVTYDVECIVAESGEYRGN
ncbi:hypothetical protein CAEBREN_11679 [Caenorhabditis brenneri]|uniref:Uncharacterized protein n=1 Tax=Caenorhabditis brenneri TaxID=135651 RepID=G0PIN9_CAEBE|nr:hypothetical protein CAEBREN_11679 [Caenorhabditis brenneri]